MPTTYTPGEVTQLLGIPGSSLRRYVSRFGSHLSADANRRRGRSFTDADLSILSRIRDLAAAGVGLEEIGDQLANVVLQDPPDQNSLALPGVLKEVQNFRNAIERQQSQIASIQARIDDLERRLSEWEALPWWRRLFTRRPGQDL